MTETDLQAIEQRAASATPGPWEWEHGPNGMPYNLQVEVAFGGVRVHPWVLLKTVTGWEPTMATADFIAHARTDVPALIEAMRERNAEIERLRGEIESLRQSLAHCMENAGEDSCAALALENSRLRAALR